MVTDCEFLIHVLVELNFMFPFLLSLSDTVNVAVSLFGKSTLVICLIKSTQVFNW